MMIYSHQVLTQVCKHAIVSGVLPFKVNRDDGGTPVKTPETPQFPSLQRTSVSPDNDDDVDEYEQYGFHLSTQEPEHTKYSVMGAKPFVALIST